MFTEKNRSPNFFSNKIDLSICPNTYEFFQIFFKFFSINGVFKN